MALKTLMLRKKLDKKKGELEQLRAKDADFQKRSAEIEAAINEINENSSPEEQAAVDSAIAEFSLKKETHEQVKSELEKEISEIETELATAEADQSASEPKQAERKEEKTMNIRTKDFFGRTRAEAQEFVTREDVKGFLERVRSAIKEKRAITGTDALIPTVVLDIIRENVFNYSKLYRHVRVRTVGGKARQNVMGTIPEAVWTEMCAKINEINLTYNGVEIDGYKVAAFVPVCNSTLADSDVDLASEIIVALSQAIGYALDKAIIYGTGTKMPMGIVTRLAQTRDPQNDKSTIPWTNLSKTNLIGITGKTDLALFKDLVLATGAAKGRYSRGEKFWVMNETTRTKLLANAMSINAAGAIVAGVNGEMPVIGGIIEVLDFMPDDIIVGGYGDLYLLAERAETSIEYSREFRFTDDNTVFKATARYDGLPVIAEAFVGIGIGGTAPAANNVTFAADTANTPTEPASGN